MRIKLLLSSCFLAVVFLAIALRGTWGSGMAEDGTRFDVSLHGVSHVLHPKVRRSASKDCTYLTGKGAVEYCAPAPEGDAPFSMLCSVFPLILSRIGIALLGGLFDSGALDMSQRIVLGALIIIFLIVEPDGLVALWDRLKRRVVGIFHVS